ncbi:hypothetical protein RB653_004356 [Dictyostelium firmibasis]|uniref:Uncharacterized protein n=1 Tax=Dictyostelium firmibasis TaxID=79012 RepID=A0AAN7Z396_9MYCE
MMINKYLTLLFVCLLIGNVYSATTIKGYTTTPNTNPESVEDNGSKVCSGITVDVKLSEKPTGTITAKFPNNDKSAPITAVVSKTDPDTYTLSGFVLKEEGNLDGIEVLLDGTVLANDAGVTPPTLKCLASTTNSSSEAGSSNHSGSTSESVDTPPAIKSISVSQATMEPTINSGQKFCTGVKVNFQLDKIVQTSYLEPKYNSFPATGKNTVTIDDSTKPDYYFTLDVSLNGNLDDLYILYNKTTKITLPNQISFKCQEAAANTDPTSVKTLTTQTSSAKSKDGICSGVTVDFTLDNEPTAITDITVASASITGTPSITKSGTTYSATFIVKEGGDLSDFQVNFKGTPLKSTASVTFKCEKDSGTNSHSDDGSTSSSLSANTIAVFCFTAFLLFISN